MATKKKLIKQLIAKAAAQAPLYFRHSHEEHILTGEQMIAQGIYDIDGVKVIPNHVYKNPFPVQIAINHKRKLKKLHKEYGEDVIPVYIEAMNLSQ